VTDLGSDGKIAAWWVAAIANIALPTVAEINAGTKIDTYITADGLKTDADTDPVNSSSLSSTFTTNKAGRRKFDAAITYKRQMPRVLESVLVHQAVGYLVVRREVAATAAVASAQKVEVYPVDCGHPSPAYGPSEMQRITVPLFLNSDASTDAAVA
jgi:hypothetical protein